MTGKVEKEHKPMFSNARTIEKSSDSVIDWAILWGNDHVEVEEY